MNKAIASFLVFLMLTPSLACAMPVCATQSSIEAHTGHDHKKHHSGEQSKHGDKDSSVRFLLDCMGVDLQKAEASTVVAPDAAKLVVAFIPVKDSFASILRFAEIETIRGPPDKPDHIRSGSSVILITQRFLL